MLCYRPIQVSVGEGRMPTGWTDAVLVAIPKKGDLSVCDNWIGVSHGFRKGTGLVDIIFCEAAVLRGLKKA